MYLYCSNQQLEARSRWTRVFNAKVSGVVEDAWRLAKKRCIPPVISPHSPRATHVIEGAKQEQHHYTTCKSRPS
jgi:hypothetical protein